MDLQSIRGPDDRRISPPVGVCAEACSASAWDPVTPKHFPNKMNDACRRYWSTDVPTPARPTSKRWRFRMARAKKVVRRKWPTQDVRQLKARLREKVPAKKIGREMKRTEGAVRQKVFQLGISTGTGRPSRRKKKAPRTRWPLRK